MNRRRFLKYAGATAAVAGASALGLNYISQQGSSTASPATSGALTHQLSTTPSSTSTEAPQLASLRGRLFFDYSGNGIQDGEEPAVQKARVILKKSTGAAIAEAVTDSSGDYKLEDIHVGIYTLLVEADKKFRYMCRSSEEFRGITEGYELSVGYWGDMPDMNIGLMEGFLTLPFGKEVKYTVGAYVDLDLGPAQRDWKGGSLTGIDNHRGIDYLMPVGQKLLAMAPGWIVEAVDNWPSNPESRDPSTGALETGNRITICHGHDPHFGSLIGTHVCHLRQGILVEPRKLDYNLGAQRVRRGQALAYSGNTGKLSFAPHVHAQVWVGSLSAEGYVDPYKALLGVHGDPSHSPSFSLWTKENDPQYNQG